MYPNYQQNYVTPQQNQLIQQMLANSYSNQLSNPTVPQECHVVRVNGEPGARSYMLPPNSDAVLIDTTASMIWLVQTDGAGYKTLTSYDISPHEEQKPEDSIKRLEDRILKLEEKINNGKSYNQNTKPYIANSRPRKPEQQCDVASSGSNDQG
jgi:hypothetical protein